MVKIAKTTKRFFAFGAVMAQERGTFVPVRTVRTPVIDSQLAEKPMRFH